jgi:hypothetical protein
MSWKILVCTGLLCVVASTASADPAIRVIHPDPGGVNNKITPVAGTGNQWLVQVMPDGPLLWSNPQIAGAEGASLAVQIDAVFPSGVTNAVAGTVLPDNNPGNDPFNADAVATGVTFSGSNVFVAVGGPVSPGPLLPVFPGDTDMDNDTDGDDFTKLSLGWDPLHTGAGVPGGRADADYDSNGFVDGDDFTLLSLNWLRANWITVATVTTSGSGGQVMWGNQTVLDGTPQEFMSSRIAQAGQNFDGLTGMNTPPALGGASLSGGAVPEPASALLLALGTLMLGGCRRRG